MSKFNQSGYHKGLNKQQEAVISDHYIYKLMLSNTEYKYNQQRSMERAIYIEQNVFDNQIIPAICSASEKFITNRIEASLKRSQSNFSHYGRKNNLEITTADRIAEVMFDRQFLKGPKYYYNRMQLSQEIQKLIDNKQTITMVIVALPFKSASPIKCRGALPDLAEVDFLLNLYEITQVITKLYQSSCDVDLDSYAKIIIISDGLRFNQIVNYPYKKLKLYQDQLIKWIKKLNIEKHIELVDYNDLLLKKLPEYVLEQKRLIKQNAILFYKKTMGSFSDFKTVNEALTYGIQNDPDPELINSEGRFIPLFKSLLFSMTFQSIIDYCQKYHLIYDDIYLLLIGTIFQPDVKSSDNALEELRLSMIDEAWQAAIRYISEIKSDRELENEPILTCIPGAIRWTIHAKPGQLGLLTSTFCGNQILPWHGVSVFKLTRKNKLKQYTMPVIELENMEARPVFINNCDSNQPVFYIDKAISNQSQLMSLLINNLSRTRKS